MAVDPSHRSVRIRIDLNEQSLPVIFSYQELHKRTLKATRPATPPPVPDIEHDEFLAGLLERAAKYDMHDEDEDEDEDDCDDDLPLQDGKKRALFEDYDFEDPFIDDSEMLLDEPYDYPLPEFESFFVFKGPLEGAEAVSVLKDEQHRRTRSNTTKQKQPPKSKRKVSEKTSSEDQQSQPVIEISDTESLPEPTNPARPAKKLLKSQKKPTSTSWTNNNRNQLPAKKRKTAPEDELPTLDPPILEDYIKKIQKEATHVSFKVKSAFPQDLRPVVLEAGSIMFRHKNRVEPNFIAHLMAILPYNRFTLTKFLTIKVGPERMNELDEEYKHLLGLLKEKVSQDITCASQSGKLELDEKSQEMLCSIINTKLATIDISNSIAEYKKDTASMINREDAKKKTYQSLLECWPEGRMTIEQLVTYYSNARDVIMLDDDMGRPTSACTDFGAQSFSIKSLAVKSEPEPEPSDTSNVIPIISLAKKYPTTTTD